jgi:hypothetical protein
MNNINLKVLREFRHVSLCPGFMSRRLTCALGNFPFYKYVPVVILFLSLIELYMKLLIITYGLRYACIMTNMHTFSRLQVSL